MAKDIYQPAEDSLLLLEQVKRHASGRALDMGTGSGILAVTASRKCSSVLAVDINPGALATARSLASKEQRKNLRFMRSDLFEKVSGKFDTIIFNPPYLPQDEGILDPSIYGGKQGHELSERFFDAAAEHLNDMGIILYLFSSLTGKAEIERILGERLFEFSQLASQRLFFEELYVYQIKKTDLLKSLSEVKGLRLFARGKRGLVFVGTHKGKKVAVKVKNPSSAALGRMAIEATQLAAVNRKGIGPKLTAAGEGYIVMEFVDGIPILDYLKQMSKGKIIKVISRVLMQLYELDKLGLNKEEMHHPIKHIIVRNGQPVLIDFERAKYGTKAHNVTQFCQFLGSSLVAGVLAGKGIRLDKQRMMRLAAGYGSSPDGAHLEKIIRYISQTAKR